MKHHNFINLAAIVPPYTGEDLCRMARIYDLEFDVYYQKDFKAPVKYTGYALPNTKDVCSLQLYNGKLPTGMVYNVQWDTLAIAANADKPIIIESKYLPVQTDIGVWYGAPLE